MSADHHSPAISLAHTSDIAQLSDLFREIITPLDFINDGLKLGMLMLFTGDGLAQKISDPVWKILVNRVNQTRISSFAFACTMGKDDYSETSVVEPADALYVWGIGVHPDFRGHRVLGQQTLSDQFLQTLEASARAARLERMETTIMPENIHGIRLFERHKYLSVRRDSTSGVTYDHYHFSLRPAYNH